jgi:hypothetical protein
VKHVISVLAASCVILLVLASGCADVTAKQKVGDFGTAFGTSSDEQKAIDWFKTTYGDPLSNNDQPARFLEPMITTGLSTNNMPVDKVTTFPVSGGSVYFFVIYDNFKKGDPITVSWVYMENGREVTKVEKQAGGDFGRFIVEFQKPDSGWGKGNQKITVSGSGATSSVNFAIGDSLQTTALPYNPSASTGNPGRIVTGEKPSAGFGRIKVLPTQLPTGTAIVTTTQAGSVSTPVTPKGPDTSSDANNCGSVGNKCTSPPNTRPYCYQGQCTWDCLDEHRFCGDLAEGCVPLYNSNNRCGNCNTKCGSGEYCNVNHCEKGNGPNSMSGADLNSQEQAQTAGSCPSGTKSCNGICADLTSDSKNCGICGFACPSGFACNSKLCLPSATQICSNFACPPLTHCEVFNNIPVCVVDPTVCDKMPPCPPLMHCEVKLGAPVCVF